MIVSIHQMNFLPWIGFFAKIIQSDQFVILDHINFSKGQFENRVKIKNKTDIKWLTVPVKKVSKGQAHIIRKAEIDYSTKWDIKLNNLIIESYRKSSFFNEYFPSIENIILSKKKFLFDLNLSLLKYLFTVFNINTIIRYSSELNVCNLKGHDMNMAIIHKLKADQYISGAMGINYLNEEDFKKNNIILNYQNIHFPTYKQLHPNFTPGLSILDYLFNCGPEKFYQFVKN